MKAVISKWVDQYLSSEEAVLLTILLVVAVLVVSNLGSTLAPVFAALVIAFLLQGVINWLVVKGFPARGSFVLTYLFFTIAFVSVIFGLVPAVVRQVQALMVDTPKIIATVRDTLETLPEKYAEYISPEQYQLLLGRVSSELGDVAEQALTLSLSSFPGVMAVLVYMVLIPLLVFFMLKDKDELLGFVGSMLPKRRRVMLAIWLEMNDQVANYIRGKAIEILIVGLVSYLAFLLLGLDYAALLALLVGLSVLIPYIGATVVTFPVLLVGYFQWGFTADFFWLFGVYSVIQFLDGNVLVPLLFSEVVNLHPVSIIIAVLLFGGLWGFWGVFFAIPLATLVKALYSAWPRGQVDDVVLEGDESASPATSQSQEEVKGE